MQSEEEKEILQEQLEYLSEQISKDSSVIPKTRDTEELEETFHSYQHTIKRMRKQKESGKSWSADEETVFVGIQEQVLQPIAERMKFLEEISRKKYLKRMWLIHDTLFLSKKRAKDLEDGKDTVRKVFVGVDRGFKIRKSGETASDFGSWIFSDKQEALLEIEEYNKC